MKKSQKKQKIITSQHEDLEDRVRQSSTKGWKEELENDVRSALPIKSIDGKIVHIKRVKDQASSNQQILNENDSGHSNETNMDGSELGNETMKRAIPISERIARVIRELSIDQIKGIISSVCINITADPISRLVLKRNKPQSQDSTANDDINSILEFQYDMKDLIELFRQDISQQISELAMLSACILFKDIAPSNKIRQTTNSTSNGGEVKLKKETKRLMDFETNLLTLYKNYIDILIAKANRGLGIIGHESFHKRSKSISVTDKSLGISALRCQCELLRKIPHFNYRDELMSAIAHRASSTDSDPKVIELCCQTISYLFERDTQGELSYETIRTISSILTLAKYAVSESLLETLQHVHLTVHADKADDIRKIAKKEKRKRKRHSDDVDVDLMESNAVKDKKIVEKFQVNCLKEIAMIYFRIIKVKIGFDLFSVALEGLGKITHLINIDMIEDLVPLLKDILVRNPPVPSHVKLLCVHCVLKTILGPGHELQVDDEVFMLHLIQLLSDLPADFQQWYLVFEAIDAALLKRRETRHQMITSIIRGLCTVCCHLRGAIGATGLMLAHSVLLRYPKIRIETQILSNKTFHECDPEEVVEDLAMKALKESTLSASDGIEMQDANRQIGGDGTLIINLIRHHSDKRFQKVVDAMLIADIRPVPYSINDCRLDNSYESESIQNSLQSCPSTIKDIKKKRVVKVTVSHEILSAMQPVQKVNGLWKYFCRARMIG